MTPEEQDQWITAGRMAAEALAYGVSLIVPGARLIDVCDAVDSWIISHGGKPAWPTQISCNAVAAHATAAHGDETVFSDHVASIDVGVQINGVIGDNAATVDLSGKYTKHLDAARAARDAAVALVRPGVTLGEIGAIIQKTIESYGLHSVRNLSGHGISPFVIHDAPSVPNFANGSTHTLEAGQVIAIEPFATDGAGMVSDNGVSEIFAFEGRGAVRNPITRKVQDFIAKEYGAFPFAKRWLIKEFGPARTQIALNDLVRAGSVTEHPPLVEKTGGVVAVFEHTVLVLDEPIVTTRV